MPTGLVKSTIHAPVRRRRATSSRDLEHHRHGAQRLGEAAGAGRLLADRAELVGQRLVDQARLLAADAQLDQHEVGAVERLVASPVVVSCPSSRRGGASAGQAADDLEPLGVDVEAAPARPRSAASMRRAMPSTSSGV